jgi:F0F1-type ATP synthase assembly protein I
MTFAITVFAVWVLFGWATPAYAYVDPGSGGMLVQLLLGGVAGVAVIVRLYWRRFLNAIGLNKAEPDQEP